MTVLFMGSDHHQNTNETTRTKAGYEMSNEVTLIANRKPEKI
jgi:hypothetical protein